MISRTLQRLVVALIVSFTVSQSLFAWNAAGHRTIASIICRRLPETRRLELAELLTQHPRYQADFVAAIPESLKDADPLARAEWMLQQASVWPDIVRGGPPERKAFNRPSWHYLPKAFYLSAPSAAFKTSAESKMNSRLDPVGGTSNLELNGPQAFKANLAVLTDEAAPKPERAVALCWVLHIGEDLHQPCHTASLCLPHLFPDGDRGGNSVKTQQQQNLHAVWDGPLGPDDRFETCRDLAITLVGDAQPETIGERIGTVDVEVTRWIEEGLVLEKEAVYIGELRDEISAVEAAHGVLPVIKLSVEYLRNVRAVSDKRFVAAGARLAQLLK